MADDLLDQRHTATAASAGPAGVAHVDGGTRAFADDPADRAIRNPVALADQHPQPPDSGPIMHQ